MENLSLIDNEFLRQFEAEKGKEKIILEYVRQERKIFLTKLKFNDELISDSELNIFLGAVFNKIREYRLRIVPTSPEVSKFFRKNKNTYKDLIPIGISI